MKQFVFFTVCAIILFTFIPQSYAELYYNEKYSFSVDIPSGWIVEDLGVEDYGVWVCDGNEELAFGVLDVGVWNTCVTIYYYPDWGAKQSDARERALQIDEVRGWCTSATYAEASYTCENFRVDEKMPTAITIDGYPRITTITTETNYYPTYPVQDMVNTVSYIYVGNDEWNIITTSDSDVWDEHQSKIFHLINSFHYPAAPPDAGGGCLIATAAFGSEMAPQVQFLRELRDNTVLQTESGTSFMTGFNQFYYSFSPAVADYERENPAFKEAVKITLTPLLASLTLLQYADIDSESEMLGYGTGVILLNIGMYFVAPAVLIMKLRKKI
jgi:hypothetical protein